MKRAEQAALREYPPSYSKVNRNAKRIQSYKVDTHKPIRQIYIKGYEQAEKDLIPLINRLCEAILFDWEDKDQAELAWKIQSQIKEETK